MSDQDYFNATGTRVSFDVIYRQMKAFYKNRGSCIFHIKTTDVCVSEEGRQKFFDIFGDICDEIFIEQVSPFWPEFDLEAVKSVFDKNTHGAAIKNLEVCPYIFTIMVVNADGSIDICAADWKRKVVLGDVNIDSLYDVWHGNKINAIRREHLKIGRKGHVLCGACKFPDFTAIDNIDIARESILKRLNRRYGNEKC